MIKIFCPKFFFDKQYVFIQSNFNVESLNLTKSCFARIFFKNCDKKIYLTCFIIEKRIISIFPLNQKWNCELFWYGVA